MATAPVRDEFVLRFDELLALTTQNDLRRVAGRLQDFTKDYAEEPDKRCFRGRQTISLSGGQSSEYENLSREIGGCPHQVGFVFY